MCTATKTLSPTHFSGALRERTGHSSQRRKQQLSFFGQNQKPKDMLRMLCQPYSSHSHTHPPSGRTFLPSPWARLEEATHQPRHKALGATRAHLGDLPALQKSHQAAACGELTPLGGQAELSLPALCFKKLMKSWACARERGRASRCLPAKTHIPLTFQRVSSSYSSALPWGQSLRPGGGRSLLKATLASRVCSIPAPGSLPGSRQWAGTLSQPATMSASPEITFRTQNISLHHSANISSCKRNKEARRAA